MQLVIHMIPLREQDKSPKQPKGANERETERMWGGDCLRGKSPWKEEGAALRGAQEDPAGLDVAFPPGSELQRLPQFAQKWCFVVPLTPGSMMGLGWVRSQRSIISSATTSGRLRWIQAMWGASWMGGWPVDPPCTPGPLGTSGLALNFREHVASCIEISQIRSLSLSVP